MFLKVADFTDAAIHINATGKQNTEGIAGKENRVLCQQYDLHYFFFFLLAELHRAPQSHSGIASGFIPPAWPI